MKHSYEAKHKVIMQTLNCACIFYVFHVKALGLPNSSEPESEEKPQKSFNENQQVSGYDHEFNCTSKWLSHSRLKFLIYVFLISREYILKLAYEMHCLEFLVLDMH